MVYRYYTKRRLDYIWFEVDGDEILTEIDPRTLAPAERLIKSPSALGLPEDNSINGVFAYYYDTVREEIKFVVWERSHEYDTRGYVEAKCYSTIVSDLDQLAIDYPFLGTLADLAMDIVSTVQGRSTAVAMIDLSALFPEKPEENALSAFLTLLYRLLPTDIADRVVFINGYGTALTFGRVASGTGRHRFSFDGFSPAMLRLLHQASREAYPVFLRAFFYRTFGVTLPPLTEEKEKAPSMRQRVSQLLRIWEQVSVLEGDDSETVRSTMLRDVLEGLQRELDSIAADPSFRSKLESYDQFLDRLLTPQGDMLREALGDRMLFQRLHPLNGDVTPRECFDVLQTLQESILPKDKRAYSSRCLSCLRGCSDAKEIEETVARMTGGGLEAFIRCVDISGEDADQLRALYDSMLDDLIAAMHAYDGVGGDARSTELLRELDAVQAFADACGYPFQERVYEAFAVGCQDALRLSLFSPYYLYEGLTLEQILRLVERASLADLYFPLHIAMLSAVGAAIEQSEMPYAEQQLLTDLLLEYTGMRIQLDRLMAEAEQPLSSLERDIESLAADRSRTARSMLEVYNGCATPLSRRVLRMICRSIIASPGMTTLFMLLYRFEFTDRKNNAYSNLVQFYDLLYLPLLWEDTFSFRDLRSIVWMFERSELDPQVRATIAKAQDEPSFITPLFRKLTARAVNEETFLSTLTARLCEERGLRPEEQSEIGRAVAEQAAQYKQLICGTCLEEQCRLYTRSLKKYISSVIEDI